MQLHTDLIDTPKALQDLCRVLEKETLIAFDTEFIRENTFAPKLALIQVGTANESWLVDAVKLTPEEMKPFLEILTKPTILKAMHSAHGDEECLYYAYRMTASPILDTFEAASLVGFGDSVSLRDLVRSLIGVKMVKDHTRTDWLKRPVNEEMKQYALADVQYLVEVARQLLAKLEELGRKDWAFELSGYFQDPSIYQDSSEEIAHRLAMGGRISRKSYGILKALVAWREQRARQIDIPRRRVADDGALIDIANARPRSLAQLEKFRGLNRGEISRQGKQLLHIIECFANQPENEWPRLPDITKPTASQSRVVDLLGTYLRTLSEELRIAPRQLLTARELRIIVADNLLNPEDWVRRGLCREPVAKLVGPELTAMLKGQRALAIETDRLKIMKLDGGNS